VKDVWSWIKDMELRGTAAPKGGLGEWGSGSWEGIAGANGDRRGQGLGHIAWA
jgi:hypothetical protein